jgi:FkbM family methyltransferase
MGHQFFADAKSWVADQLGLRRLFGATSYLLLRELNANSPPEGPEGNRRLQDAFFELFEKLRPNLFLDIGANDGATSIAVREVDSNCAIHAFEANPRIYEKNRSRLEERGIKFWNRAVSDRAGVITVYAPLTLSRAYVAGEVIPASITEDEDTGKTSLLRRNEDATYAEFEVEATTLDTFVDTWIPDWLERTIFLWIDVEGASDRVLTGSKRLLTRTRAIFLETEGFDFWHDQADSGLVVTRLIRAGFLPVGRDREYGDKQFNILFVHHHVLSQILPLVFDQKSSLQLTHGRQTQLTEPPGQNNSVRSLHRYASIGGALQANIPVFIPCFNTVTYVRSMVTQLQARGFGCLYLVDNGSTYPPMREYLASPGSGVTVIAQAANKGPRQIYSDPESFTLLPQIFCVTDPDLLLSVEMPDDFVAQLVALTERLYIGKAGLALDIADPTVMRQEEFQIKDRHWKIWEWEQQFWREPLEALPGGDPVYRAAIDTTFAVYNKRFFDPHDPLNAVRVAGRFTCRHLPWYRERGLPLEEEQFYKDQARYSYYLGEPPSE